MFPRFAATLLGCALIAGTAAAQSAGTFDGLTAGQQMFVNALTEAQQPVDSTLAPLSGEEIALRRGDSGWGKLFNDLKAEGYYPADMTFGEVVSTYRHEQNDLRREALRAEKAELKSERPRPMADRFSRPERIERPDRPDRPERLERPERNR